MSPTFLPALLASLTLLGFLRCIVRRRTVIEYYVFVYVGVLLLYPATHLQRYVVPVIPFLWFYFFVSSGGSPGAWLGCSLDSLLSSVAPGASGR